MSDPIEDFFNGLAHRGYEPLLQHTVGSVRYDLISGEGTDHWWVAIDRGKVTVAHEDRVAGSVVRQERQTLVDTIEGRVNPLTAFLRGEAGYTGETEPLVVFQRLFPERDDPPAQPKAAQPVGAARPDSAGTEAR
jgi:hypothetical protein